MRLKPHRNSGARRETPVILTVDAAAMHAAGPALYQAANGVWPTDHVPPGYLSGWPGYGRISTYPSVPCTRIR